MRSSLITGSPLAFDDTASRSASAYQALVGERRSRGRSWRSGSPGSR